MLNGRKRESGAQTPARWERGREQRCSDASVQRRLKGGKKNNNKKPRKTKTCAAQLVREKFTFPSVVGENK